MTSEHVLGLLGWMVLSYPIWSPRCRRIRRSRWRRQRVALARASRSPKAVAAAAKYADLMEDVNPTWEQDKPFPEVFEDDEDGEEDDL